jgi:hypothetical protein
MMAGNDRQGLARRGKLAFQSLANRITGFSIPLFGVQWNPPAPERETVRKLLRFLEDRRALYVDHWVEIPSQVTHSVLEIRQELTRTLQTLPDNSNAVAPIRAMRAACRKFFTEPRPDFRNLAGRHHPRSHRMDDDEDPGFFVALGELRATFGVQIAALAVAYGIDVEDELASILPVEDGEDV